MNPFNRRNFLFASSGAVAGALVVPGTLEAVESGPIDFSQSGLVTGQVKPLKHKEIPGFLWNRVWFAMLREMLHLVDIGAVDPLELDSLVQTTLRAFVPLFGPLQMTDLIGQDTLRDISNALYPELAADRTASRTVEQHIADGRLGVKSGQGFYDDNDQRVADLTKKLYEVARQLATGST